MKKFYGVLKRVRELEEKKGIKYAKPDGKLYKTFKVFYIIAFAYTMAINLLFVLAMLIKVDAGLAVMSDVFNYILSVSVCSVLIIAGLVLLKFKLNLTAGIISILSEVFLIPVYAIPLKADFGGILGLKYSFYYKHGIPLLLMIIFFTGMTIIAKRAEYKTDKMYKKVTENLFGIYAIAEGEAENLSEEQWDEFLRNYDPDDYESHATIAVKEEITESVDDEE